MRLNSRQRKSINTFEKIKKNYNSFRSSNLNLELNRYLSLSLFASLLRCLHIYLLKSIFCMEEFSEREILTLNYFCFYLQNNNKTLAGCSKSQTTNDKNAQTEDQNNKTKLILLSLSLLLGIGISCSLLLCRGVGGGINRFPSQHATIEQDRNTFCESHKHYTESALSLSLSNSHAQKQRRETRNEPKKKPNYARKMNLKRMRNKSNNR